MDSTGRIIQVKLAKSTGNADIDALAEAALMASGKLPQPPAGDMPQPVVIRVKPVAED